MSGNAGVRLARDGRVDWATLKNIPGLTYRRFDHWCTRGYIHFLRENDMVAEGSGNWRTIAEDEVPVLTLLTELVTIGLLPQIAEPIARALTSGNVGTLGNFQITRTQ